MLLDVITRTCKNAAGDTVAVQKLTVYAETIETRNTAGYSFANVANTTTARFGRTAKVYIKTTKTFTTSASATISKIETTGKFNSHETNFLHVTYTGDGAGVNDLIVPVTGFTEVYEVGDTVA